MKTKLLVFFLLIGSMSVVNYACVQAQDDAYDNQAIYMLKEFYTSYIIESSKSPTSENLTKIIATQKKYCTASLLSKINAQFKSGHVDTDPFIYAQDTDTAWLKTLSFNKDSKILNGYTVSYIIDTVSNRKVVIHVTVIKQGEHFKISSIR